jgi:S1-C subfamily serine protease
MKFTLLLTSAMLFATLACTHSKPTHEGEQQPQAVPQKAISDIAHDSLKSVVTIVTTDSAGRSLEQGSGFIVTADGKVVTNYHVIAGASSAVVKLADGGIYAVEGIVREDQSNDLVVLKVKSSERDFTPLHLANSVQSRVGEEVVAIGSPLGLEGTVSTGVISAKRTMPSSQMEVLQITAPISPGSSGGALLNSKGEVIGVPFVQMIGGQNLNFAIPIALASPLIVDAPAQPFPSAPTAVSARKTQPKRTSPPPAVTDKSPERVNTAHLDTSELNGTYSGAWQSIMYAASGAAVMTVTTQGKMVRAEIALTGGQVTRDTLTGEVSEVGGGWSVTLKNSSGNLYATGIFKKGVFEGDYDYVSASDHGRWGLKKD